MKEFYKEHKLAIWLFVAFIVASIAIGTIVGGDPVDPTALN